jgi:hypothetical protein
MRFFRRSFLFSFLLSVIVSTTQGQFEFPLELLDLQPVAPQDLVLFVNVGDFLQESLEVLECGLDGLPGVVGVIIVIDGPEGILHVVDAHTGLDEEFLEFVQTELDLFRAQGIRRRRRKPPSRTSRGGLVVVMVVGR